MSLLADIIAAAPFVALAALVLWSLVKAFRLYRKGGAWPRDENDPDGRSLSERWTSFLNYPCS